MFSVRVRDKGPDYRGFVQLPVTQPPTMTMDESALMNQSTALCFVEPCQRNFNNSILQCHVGIFRSYISYINYVQISDFILLLQERHGDVNPTVCNHIRAALRCFSEAAPLSINTSVLDVLSIDQNIKKVILVKIILCLCSELFANLLNLTFTGNMELAD